MKITKKAKEDFIAIAKYKKERNLVEVIKCKNHK